MFYNKYKNIQVLQTNAFPYAKNEVYFLKNV